MVIQSLRIEYYDLSNRLVIERLVYWINRLLPFHKLSRLLQNQAYKFIDIFNENK